MIVTTRGDQYSNTCGYVFYVHLFSLLYLLEEASFIDYEYGCYAFRGFDIGNHFNEFAGFECEYSRYPDKSFQMQWFEWYLTEYNGGIVSFLFFLPLRNSPII